MKAPPQGAADAMREPAAQHPDDAAVDALAMLMKAKLAKQRAKGYGGWDSAECKREWLSALLREHVTKGDPVDVANFCAFLSARGWGISPSPGEAIREAEMLFAKAPQPAAEQGGQSATDSACARHVWWTRKKALYTTTRQSAFAAWDEGARWALAAQAQEAAPETHAAMRLAYGWLWHAVTPDPRVHTAREALLSQLSRDDQRAGIRAARAAGAAVDTAALEAALNRGDAL